MNKPLFVPSKYQKDIFDWALNGTGSATVCAVAGSGKTTTLIEVSKLLNSSNVLFAAFNRSIADYLKTQVSPRVDCLTIHAVGRWCLGRRLPGKLKVEPDKYRKMIQGRMRSLIAACKHRYEHQLVQWHLDQENLDEPKPPIEAEIQQQLEQIVHLAQCTLTESSDYRAIVRMLRHFGIALDENYQELILNEAESVLIEGPDLAVSQRLISYDDMIWLPYLWNLQPKQYEWVFVDEAQDLSAAQLNLILKCKKPKGRMLFIGDDNQACYGFAGADCYSFQRIRDTLQGIEFPLSVCYRCDTKILELARELVPHIEARPDASEGAVEIICEDQLPKVVKKGDLIICRLVAPLITWCIELIKKQIPARVKGRDVGKSLTAIVRRVAEFEGFTFAQFPDFLLLYQGHRIRKLKDTPYSEGQIELLNDKIDGILNCYKRFNCSDVKEFCEAIEGLFSDQRQAVMLSTVHSAKGLEEERVFILYPDYLPMKWDNQQPWEYQQERNLRYIAITRSKSALFFVHKSSDDRRKKLDVDDLSNSLKLMISNATKSHRQWTRNRI